MGVLIAIKVLIPKGYTFRINGSVVSGELLASQDASFHQVFCFATQSETWRYTGVESMEEISTSEIGQTITESLGCGGDKGCVNTELGAKLHSHVDKIVNFKMVVKRLVMKNPNSTIAPRVNGKTTILHLKKYASKYDPSQDGVMFAPDGSIKDQIFDLVYQILDQNNLENLPASDLAKYIGISKRKMQTLRLQVISQMKRGGCKVKFFEAVCQSMNRYGNLGAARLAWCVGKGDVDGADEDEAAEGGAGNREEGIETSVNQSQSLARLRQFSIFEGINAALQQAGGKGLNSAQIRQITGLTMKKCLKITTDLVHIFGFPVEKYQDGKQLKYRVLMKNFTALHAAAAAGVAGGVGGGKSVGKASQFAKNGAKAKSAPKKRKRRVDSGSEESADSEETEESDEEEDAMDEEDGNRRGGLAVALAAQRASVALVPAPMSMVDDEDIVVELPSSTPLEALTGVALAAATPSKKKARHVRKASDTILSDQQVERAKVVLEHLQQNNGIASGSELSAKIRAHSLSLGHKHTIDKRTVHRLLEKLVQEGQIKVFAMPIPSMMVGGAVKTELDVYVLPTVTNEEDLLMNYMQNWNTSAHVNVKRETNKTPKKRSASAMIESAQPETPFAYDSITGEYQGMPMLASAKAATAATEDAEKSEEVTHIRRKLAMITTRAVRDRTLAGFQHEHKKFTIFWDISFLMLYTPPGDFLSAMELHQQILYNTVFSSATNRELQVNIIEAPAITPSKFMMDLPLLFYLQHFKIFSLSKHKNLRRAAGTFSVRYKGVYGADYNSILRQAMDEKMTLSQFLELEASHELDIVESFVSTEVEPRLCQWLALLLGFGLLKSNRTANYKRVYPMTVQEVEKSDKTALGIFSMNANDLRYFAEVYCALYYLSTMGAEEVAAGISSGGEVKRIRSVEEIMLEDRLQVNLIPYGSKEVLRSVEDIYSHWIFNIGVSLPWREDYEPKMHYSLIANVIHAVVFVWHPYKDKQHLLTNYDLYSVWSAVEELDWDIMKAGEVGTVSSLISDEQAAAINSSVIMKKRRTRKPRTAKPKPVTADTAATQQSDDGDEEAAAFPAAGIEEPAEFMPIIDYTLLTADPMLTQSSSSGVPAALSEIEAEMQGKLNLLLEDEWTSLQDNVLLELFLVNFLRKSTLGGLPKVLKPVDISGRASMVANQRYYVAVENSSLDVDFKMLRINDVHSSLVSRASAVTTGNSRVTAAAKKRSQLIVAEMNSISAMIGALVGSAHTTLSLSTVKVINAMLAEKPPKTTELQLWTLLLQMYSDPDQERRVQCYDKIRRLPLTTIMDVYREMYVYGLIRKCRTDDQIPEAVGEKDTRGGFELTSMFQEYFRVPHYASLYATLSDLSETTTHAPLRTALSTAIPSVVDAQSPSTSLLESLTMIHAVAMNHAAMKSDISVAGGEAAKAYNSDKSHEEKVIATQGGGHYYKALNRINICVSKSELAPKEAPCAAQAVAQRAARVKDPTEVEGNPLYLLDGRLNEHNYIAFKCKVMSILTEYPGATIERIHTGLYFLQRMHTEELLMMLCEDGVVYRKQVMKPTLGRSLKDLFHSAAKSSTQETCYFLVI